MHVLIIGGGIGGLCLAQGLKKAGISVQVYERDKSVQFRSQGYRISINADGGGALRECLPETLYKLCLATSLRTATLMVFLDQHLNQSFAKPLPHTDLDETNFGVNRLTLREILLAGLDDVVQFDKTLTRIEQVEGGQIRAQFADGSAATGDLLVGADGTNSAVRALILPDATITATGQAIYGKTPIRADTLTWMPEALIDSFNRVADPNGAAMAVATCRKRESYAEAVATFAPNVKLTDVPDYLMWIVNGWSAQMTDAQFHATEAAALHSLAAEVVRSWHPALGQIIAEADIAATFPVVLRSAEPVEQWGVPNVTLLGDAIHTMTPGRGVGANTALRDAQLLCRKLREPVPLGQAKREYEAEMLRYGFEAVAASRHNPFMKMAGGFSKRP